MTTVEGMARWVALLRGVNVNGITVKSADLAALFRDDLAFDSVKTVLASGNVLFDSDSDADPATLKRRIEKGLADRFGYDAWIVLESRERLAAIVEAYPFVEDADTHAYVIFASDAEALGELVAEPDDSDIEQVELGAGVVYWACPKGSSTDTPFAKRAAKTRFRTSTTARNLNTVRKLLL